MCADAFKRCTLLFKTGLSFCALVGHKVDRRFYFRRLLPGALARAFRASGACSYALLRNNFSEKWGFFARQQQKATLASGTPFVVGHSCCHDGGNLCPAQA